MTRIVISVDESYTDNLKARLRKYGISYNALAREMGISLKQVSRWFNSPLQPRMNNVVKIEEAVARLRSMKGRKKYFAPDAPAEG